MRVLDSENAFKLHAGERMMMVKCVKCPQHNHAPFSTYFVVDWLEVLCSSVFLFPFVFAT